MPGQRSSFYKTVVLICPNIPARSSKQRHRVEAVNAVNVVCSAGDEPCIGTIVRSLTSLSAQYSACVSLRHKVQGAIRTIWWWWPAPNQQVLVFLWFVRHRMCCNQIATDRSFGGAAPEWPPKLLDKHTLTPPRDLRVGRVTRRCESRRKEKDDEDCRSPQRR